MHPRECVSPKTTSLYIPFSALEFVVFLWGCFAPSTIIFSIHDTRNIISEDIGARAPHLEAPFDLRRIGSPFTFLTIFPLSFRVIPPSHYIISLLSGISLFRIVMLDSKLRTLQIVISLPYISRITNAHSYPFHAIISQGFPHFHLHKTIPLHPTFFLSI